MATRKLTMKQQAAEIMRLAAEGGVQSNYFFKTTFERYQVQLQVLDNLKKAIEAKDATPTVEKEYVKGRANVMINPLYPEYNRAVDSANKTVSTLMRIIKNFNVGEEEPEDEDPLLKAINGGDDYDEGTD